MARWSPARLGFGTMAVMRLAALAAWLIATAASGCGPATSPTSALAPSAPVLRRGPIGRVLVPAQLGDAGALARIPYAVRVRRLGRVWLVPDGEPAGPASAQPADEAAAWPAIAESGDRVQIVTTEDHANLALWVERVDLVPVVIDQVEVRADSRALAAPGGTVVLRAGAPVTPVARDRGADAVEVRLTDEQLELAGWVPAPAVGQVFAIEPGTPPERASAGLIAGAVIRAGAARSARVLAVTRAFIGADVAAETTPGWREVRVVTPHARVHGWVASAQASSDQFANFHTTGHGSGFGASHRLSLMVPAGTCLYASPDGEVVGVNTEAVVRLVLAVEQPGWWHATVTSRWGLHELYLHDGAGGADVGAAQLESCVEPEPHPPV